MISEALKRADAQQRRWKLNRQKADKAKRETESLKAWSESHFTEVRKPYAD